MKPLHFSSSTILCWLGLATAAGCQPENRNYTKVPNEAPGAAIAAPVDGAEVREGDTVRLEGAVSDQDDKFEDLLARWKVGGTVVCDWQAPDESGNTFCDAVVGTDGEVVLDVEDPENAYGQATITLDVTENGAPEVSLDGTDPSANLRDGVLFKLQGTLGDDDDAPTELSLVLNVDGAEWSPDSESIDSDGTYSAYLSLEEGSHVLQLTATDSGGKSTSDSLTVDVGPAQVPPDTCAFVSPSDGDDFAYLSTVPFSVTGTDPNGDSLTATISSDIDGALEGPTAMTSAGTLAGNLSGLSAGAHTLRLEVADPAGGTCSTQLSISICDTPWYADTDGDGHGDATAVTYFCPGDDTSGWSDLPDDCNDTDPDVYTGASEVCDGLDKARPEA